VSNMKPLEGPITGNGHGCRGCGRVFAGITAFDRHQRLRDESLQCLDPSTLGMVRRPNGRWALDSPFPVNRLGSQGFKAAA
jgi:hypothetical protein